MFERVSRELVCVISLSLAFMLLFAADFSMVNMQKVVVSSIADDNPEFKLDGYNVTGLLYIFFAIFVWIGPFVTYRIGPKLTMFLASIGYMIFIGSYSLETVWVIYVGAILGGIAAGILWPAQGQYIVENSSPETTARNFAIFVLMFASAGMFGNIFVYIEFYGKKYLDRSTRNNTIYALVVINIIATLSYIGLPQTKSTHEKREYGPIKSLKKSFHMLFSRRMMWMAVTFIYLGIQQAFGHGVYSACVGFTLRFGNSAKELVALSGIVYGIGALIGSLVPIVFAGAIRRHRFSRRLLVAAGISFQLAAYVIAFINLPDRSVFGNTEDRSLIKPSKTLALLGSLLLTIGDSSITTQVYALIGDHYRDSSAEAYALYKFVKGMVVSASFYVCGHIGLHTQLPVMAAAALIGAATFWIADWDNVSHDDGIVKPEKELEKRPQNEVPQASA